MSQTVTELNNHFDRDFHIKKIIDDLGPGLKYWNLLGHLKTFEEKYKTLDEYWDDLMMKGGVMNDYIVHYFDNTKRKPNKNFTKKLEREIEYFHNFWNDTKYKPFLINQFIKDESTGLIGRPDAVFVTADEPKKFILIDWTTSSNEYWQTQKSTNNLNGYKVILKKYGIIVDEMYVVILNAENTNYKMSPIMDTNMKKEQTEDKKTKISVVPIKNTKMEIEDVKPEVSYVRVKEEQTERDDVQTEDQKPEAVEVKLEQ